MKSIEFVLDYFHLLCYKCYKINSNFVRSYIDSPDWIKNKQKINPINKEDNKSFQYPVTVALNCKAIETHSERIKKVNLLEI